MRSQFWIVHSISLVLFTREFGNDSIRNSIFLASSKHRVDIIQASSKTSPAHHSNITTHITQPNHEVNIKLANFRVSKLKFILRWCEWPSFGKVNNKSTIESANVFLKRGSWKSNIRLGIRHTKMIHTIPSVFKEHVTFPSCKRPTSL